MAVLGGLFARGTRSRSVRTATHEIGTMLENFTESCLLWEGPHGIAEERLFYLSKLKKNFEWWTDQKHHTLSLHCWQEGRRGWWEKYVLKAYFTSHDFLLTVKIDVLYTCKFEPVLPLECFSPNPYLNSWVLYYSFPGCLVC